MAAKLSIDFAQEQGYERVSAKRPLLTNLAMNWNGIYFAYDYLPPGETLEVCAKQHGIAIFASTTAIRAERRLDGKFHEENVQEGIGNRLYAETLANTLLVHVLQHYTIRLPSLTGAVDRLPRQQLQPVIDYIHAHLD